jgi:hypothetical protein
MAARAPAAMNNAADDFEFIRARLAELRAVSEPKCPQAGDRTLHDCLRSSARCPDACPHFNDWIGPQP